MLNLFILFYFIYETSCKHRCYGTEVFYVLLFIYLLGLNSAIENRTLSQLCGRLYLPIFLFRVGLLTLIYMASLIALAKLYPSLHIIWKLSTVVWPLVF